MAIVVGSQEGADAVCALLLGRGLPHALLRLPQRAAEEAHAAGGTGGIEDSAGPAEGEPPAVAELEAAGGGARDLAAASESAEEAAAAFSAAR